MWSAQIERFSNHWHVIAPDLRGCGSSDVTPGTVTVEQMADDCAAILDALGVDEPVVFCGLSMGGYIAWQFAANTPSGCGPWCSAIPAPRPIRPKPARRG